MTTKPDTETGWSKEFPKEDGYYWWAISGEVRFLEIIHGSEEAWTEGDDANQWDKAYHWFGKFLGPISPSDFEQLLRLREKAMRFVLDPDNQDCYHDSFHSTSADWPPEFLQLCDAVVEHCAHTYEHEDRDPTEDPNGYCTLPGCQQPLEHWIHLGTSERDEFLKDREALAYTGEQS